MERVGYIKDEKITELGKIVLDTIRSCGADESFTDKFRAIFPSIKLPTGKNFRSNPVDIAKRLKLFSKEYSYSPETILEAAREYVRHAERENYKYIRTASYFIYKKDEGSDLASWCEKVLAEHKERTPEPQQKFV
jgi:hypothetical protein